jgi:hypothetical protein
MMTAKREVSIGTTRSVEVESSWKRKLNFYGPLLWIR